MQLPRTIAAHDLSGKPRDHFSLRPRNYHAPMRMILLLPALACFGCGGAYIEPSAALLGASMATVPVFGRTLPDMVYSAMTGQDCSAVRLEQGKSYCRAADPPPAPPLVCSNSLGVADCWANPNAFPTPPRPLADAAPLTAEQEAHRTRKWPGL
jgi:hypothetical protein